MGGGGGGGLFSPITNTLLGTPGGKNQGTEALNVAIGEGKQTLGDARNLQSQQQNFLNQFNPQFAQFGQQLASQALGQQMSPALQMALQQGQNQQAALAKSQRGVNAALASRNAANATSQDRLNAMLGATNQAQGAFGNFMGQQQGYNTNLLGNVTNAQGMLSQAAGAQASNQAELSKQQSAGNKALLGGIGSGLGLWKQGGQIPGYAAGGNVMVNPFQNVFSAPAPVQEEAGNPYADLANALMKKQEPQSAAANIDASLGNPVIPASAPPMDPFASPQIMTAAHGGQIPSRSIAASHFSNFQSGGHVHGQATVPGDSPKNDTVPALLSPGEMVIPRSVMNTKNPGDAAKKFVDAYLAKKGR